jgi:hypothetical protein
MDITLSCCPGPDLLCAACCCTDCKFGTWDTEWLDLNFKPSLLVALPWVFLPGHVVVSKSLVHEVNTLRSQGISFDLIAATLNERVANR